MIPSGGFGESKMIFKEQNIKLIIFLNNASFSVSSISSKMKEVNLSSKQGSNHPGTYTQGAHSTLA